MLKAIKKYLGWFARAIRPYRGSVWAIIGCHVLLTVSSLAFIILTKNLIDEVLRPTVTVVENVAAAAAESVTGTAIEATIEAATETAIEAASQAVPAVTAAPTIGWSPAATWMAIALLIITVLRVALNASKAYLQSRTATRTKNHMRQRLFDALLRQQIDGSKPRHSADVISRLQEDVRVLSSAFSTSVPDLIGTSIQFLACFGYLLYLDARLAWILVVVLPVGLVASKFITRKIRNLTLDIRESDTEVQSHLQENVQHLTLLKSMEYTGQSAQALGQLQNDLYDREMRRTRFSLLAKSVLSLAFSGGYILVFLWGVNGLIHGSISYGVMLAFMQLVGQVQRPLLDMSAHLPAILHSTASIDRLIDLEMLPKEENNGPQFKVARAGIRFDNVNFTYPGATHPVVTAFSHDFRPGTKTAIVGHTGVGKSTLIRLMLSLLRPSSGTVTIYGQDPKSRANDVDQPARAHAVDQPTRANAVDQPARAHAADHAISRNRVLSHEVSPATRCNLVYVPQGNSLFSGTIRDNLLMGNPDASDTELRDALHMASADFVFDLPQGLDSSCAEGGAGLSEGQAQRIAIARALLRPGSILLLDEFSSALDPETENSMLDRLTKGLPEKTMIFITHREKILAYCDEVLRLADRQ